MRIRISFSFFDRLRTCTPPLNCMHSNGKNNSQDAKGKWKEWWASISFCDAQWHYIIMWGRCKLDCSVRNKMKATYMKVLTKWYLNRFIKLLLFSTIQHLGPFICMKNKIKLKALWWKIQDKLCYLVTCFFFF